MAVRAARAHDPTARNPAIGLANRNDVLSSAIRRADHRKEKEMIQRVLVDWRRWSIGRELTMSKAIRARPRNSFGLTNHSWPSGEPALSADRFDTCKQTASSLALVMAGFACRQCNQYPGSHCS